MQPKADATPAISIIVPIYNMQDYLAETLNSILQQRFSDSLEIVLVDDCSTDNSKQICENFLRAHPNKIKLICHEQNSGLSVARNTGLAAITGTYFTFVDADDLLPPNALQSLYDAAIQYNADIIKGNHQSFDEQSYRPANTNINRTELVKGADILSTFFAHKKMRGHTWGKLFRRATLGHIKNTPGVLMAQDSLYCAEMFACANTLVLITKNVYQYRLRSSSVTGRKFQTGSYLWWLYSIENCGRFAATDAQQMHYKSLQIRTLLQLVREARTLDANQLPAVISEVYARQTAWQITGLCKLLQAKSNAETLIHFIKLKRTLHKLEQRLQQHPSAPSNLPSNKGHC